MKNQPKFLMGFLLLIFMASCNNNPCPDIEAHEKESIDKEELKAEIEEIFVLTQTLIKEKDVEGLVKRFTANGTLKLPMSPLMQGHDALRENYQNMVEMEDFSLEINTLKVNLSEAADMAAVLGEFAVSFNTPQGPFQDSGYSLFSMVRENNQWKIAAEVLSSMPQNQ
jgi:ketosteroid isomerase-like protein